MSSVDIRAEVKELQSLVGLRLANVYDLSPKLFIFKLSKPDSKAHLLMEPGIRLHTTSFAREKPQAPSPFIAKLRKHLRARRLIKIEQLGIDRVIDFAFTSGEETFHIILELYAQGNLLFTDQNYLILALLRSHTFEEEVKYAKGEIYPFIQAAGLTYVDFIDRTELEAKVQSLLGNTERMKKGMNLKQILTNIEPYMHFPFAEHCLKLAGFTGFNKKVENINFEMLVRAVEIAHEIVNMIDRGESKGILTFDIKGETKNYMEFSPVAFSQYNDEKIEIIENFDKAVDLFFSVVEKQKADTNQVKQEKEIWKKKNKIEEDQERRLKALQEDQISSERKARVIENYIFELDSLFTILKNCLATGVNWNELFRMIIEEKHRGNPYAKIVKKLKLEKNLVEVCLTDPENEEILTIEVDITKNAFQNTREYYDNKRASAVKEIKTKDHIEKVVKEADKKAQVELQKQQMKLGTGVRVIRKVYWWEKFNWFISSENYLIISGKDAQQNEMIVKKYMKKGDIYVHADCHGASSTIIKNPTLAAVPQKTLEEAGTFCVCLSSAWNNKIIQSAWWVYSHQVSKTAPTGLYLSVGSFMIRGKKNFLHPSKLEMSIVLLFKLDENSLSHHIGERRTQEVLSGLDTIPENIENDEEWTISNPNFEKKTQKGGKIKKTQQKAKEVEKEKEKEKEKEIEKEKEKVKEKGKKKDEPTKNEPSEQDKLGGKNKPLTARQAKKLKKIKEKYAFQTEEEKQARLKLLGSKEVKFAHMLEKQPEDKQNKVEEVEEEEDKDSELEEEDKKKESESEGSEENKDNEENKEIEKKLEEKKQIKHILDEENILGEEEMKALTETDSLTGQPIKDDVLLFCVPMCAPHIATNSYKYRIKLIPGGLKKGKAVGLMTFSWLNMDGAFDIEKQLIKNMNETDLISVLPGKVSIATAAVKKVQQASKKNKN